MPAILFGSISTVADTSELQRAAFNAAFAEHGLDWTWEHDEYVAMLGSNGGAGRIASYAAERGEHVDAEVVHATKSRIFQERLRAGGATLRPGVADLVSDARAEGLKVGLVTTTSLDNLTALGESLAPELSLDDFDVVIDSSQVASPKPDPEAYALALQLIGEPADACVAIEDNVGGVDAATAAGLAVVAFPNANTAGQSFDTATARREDLALADIRALSTGAAAR